MRVFLPTLDCYSGGEKCLPNPAGDDPAKVQGRITGVTLTFVISSIPGECRTMVSTWAYTRVALPVAGPGVDNRILCGQRSEMVAFPSSNW